ncbi:DUF4038 domain-containing protein [Deinococcus sp. SM5_A1]|uniref:apiosidase-like domain-containing protein n=1 Tax=Deinococcus sp. SM5_A1 TaxID=3379094 RepID=UPI00385C0B28
MSGLAPLSVAQAAAQPFSGDGVYALKNACAGLALDVESAGAQNGARAIVWPYVAAANQQWNVQEISAGRHRLSALHSGKVLDVDNAGKTAGTRVIQWSDTGGVNQQWQTEAAADGTFRLRPAYASELALEVLSAPALVGSAVGLGRVAAGASTCSSRWKIERVARPASTNRLAVSKDGHSLIHADGSPFLYLADTAWELPHRLDRAETVRYLDARQSQGFTAIQTVALAELDGPTVTNAYGDLPFKSGDPARPATTSGSDPKKADEYDYWDHLDYVIEQAGARGMYVTLLPTWGQWVSTTPLFTPASARSYGRFLGQRYSSAPVIWMLGGDRNPDTTEKREIWRAMAAGLEEGAGSAEKALISYHPGMGYGSAQWFHKEAWLDFNTWQTGHCRLQRVWEKIGQTWAEKPTKPVLNAEPIYDNHPVCFDAASQGYSDATDVRTVAYWSVFSGAFGASHGHHSVWQMFDKGRKGINGPQVPWTEGLNAPGANQMRYLRTLLEDRPALGRVPDTNLVIQLYDDEQRIVAARGDGYALVYTAVGKPIEVRSERLPGDETLASWYNPRTGQTTSIGKVSRKGLVGFTPPSKGHGNDWVLVLDDAAKEFRSVGQLLK